VGDLARAATPLAACLVAAAFSCSSPPPPTSDLNNLGRDSGSGSGASSGSSVPQQCTGLREGCLCSPSGASAACTAPKVQIGTHEICPPGVMVCTGGYWGACVATDISTAVTSQVQDYESTCTLGTHVQWSPLGLTGQVPTGATIVIGLQSAPSKALLDQEAYEVAGTFDAQSPQPWQPIDVPMSLSSAGQDPLGVYLRVTALLTPTAGGQMPIVSFAQSFVCVNPPPTPDGG
jgi:hypothetical protein